MTDDAELEGSAEVYDALLDAGLLGPRRPVPIVTDPRIPVEYTEAVKHALRVAVEVLPEGGAKQEVSATLRLLDEHTRNVVEHLAYKGMLAEIEAAGPRPSRPPGPHFGPKTDFEVA